MRVTWRVWWTKRTETVVCCERDAGFARSELMVLRGEWSHRWPKEVMGFLNVLAQDPCVCEGDEQCVSCSAGFLWAMGKGAGACSG